MTNNYQDTLVNPNFCLGGLTAFHTVCRRAFATVRLFSDFSSRRRTFIRGKRNILDFTQLAKLMIESTQYSITPLDLNAKDDNGNTAFHHACITACKYSTENDSIDSTVKMFLEIWREFGINIKVQNNDGQTALDILRENDTDELKEVRTMCEEEYSKVDTAEPTLKRRKK